jgi:Tol biopolymer transport system component
VQPNTERFVFASTRHSKHSHLYVKPIRGAVITQITDEPADDVQPAFSPSGDRIAFASNRTGQWDIWVIDASGRNPIRITNNPMPELHPSWSPDGERLVYCRLNTKEGRGELWVVGLKNAGVKRFIGEGLFPDWSPLGNKIVYQRARVRGSRWFSIWTLDLIDDEVLYPSEIASSPHAAYISPDWAGDGKQIVFTSVVAATSCSMEEQDTFRITGDGRSDIVIVDTDGRGLQRLTDGRGENYSPTWAPDGRIFFTAKLNDNETIWSIKPFKPGATQQPAVTTNSRRAAQVMEKRVGP